MRVAPAILALSFVCVHCSLSAESGSADDALDQAALTHGRDWVKNPAIVQLDSVDDIYAISDPHGEYEILSRILASNRLINAANPDPARVKWTGGNAVLVIAGDLIDKGPESVEVIDLVRALQTSAAQSNGRVIATLGNHEAEFLLDPRNDKAMSTGEDATGIDSELDALHIAPESLHSGTDATGRGVWLASLPFAVRINSWFFAHGGNTSKLSMKDLTRKLEHALDRHGFGDSDVTGNDSILEAQGWYGPPDDDRAGRKAADALGVKHIVFGHDPGAFGEHGRIRASKNGVLVKIDTAMGMHLGSDIGKPFLLHVKTAHDEVEVLDEHGLASALP